MTTAADASISHLSAAMATKEGDTTQTAASPLLNYDPVKEVLKGIIQSCKVSK